MNLTYRPPEERLELLINEHGLRFVLETIANVCIQKSARACHSNTMTAKSWARDGKAIIEISRKMGT